MRLFIAISLSDEVKKELKRVQEKLKGELKIVKEPHLTLKFLGETSLDKLKGLEKVEFKPFELMLTEINFFPTAKKPRVVWVGVKPEQPVIELQQQIEKNIPFEKDFRFKPHITIARVKHFKFKIDSLNVASLKFVVNSFKLYKSTLTSEGPLYEVVKEYKAK